MAWSMSASLPLRRKEIPESSCADRSWPFGCVDRPMGHAHTTPTPLRTLHVRLLFTPPHLPQHNHPSHIHPLIHRSVDRERGMSATAHLSASWRPLVVVVVVRVCSLSSCLCVDVSAMNPSSTPNPLSVMQLRAVAAALAHLPPPAVQNESDGGAVVFLQVRATARELECLRNAGLLPLLSPFQGIQAHSQHDQSSVRLIPTPDGPAAAADQSCFKF